MTTPDLHAHNLPSRLAQSPQPLRILIVDDEETIRCVLSVLLETAGHRVQSVTSAQAALAAAQQASFDLALIDVRLGTSSGMDLLPRLLADQPSLKIIMITAFASVDLAVEAMARGAIDFLCKPFTPEQVEATVERAAELLAMENDVGAILSRDGAAGPGADFATTSAQMQQAVILARRVAPSSIPVLIVGERGTGKRVLARAMHGWSSHGPCKVINCAERSAHFVELAIFGQSTVGQGMVQSDHPPLLQQCRGGTLIITRLESLAEASQARLVRLLQDGRYEQPGTLTSLACETRLIMTAESVPSAQGAPQESTAAGAPSNIHPELRLDRVTIELPPLRCRAGDIPMLAQRYLAYQRQLADSSVLGFGAAALDVLMAFPWPGNLTELRQTVAAALAACNADYIEPAHLPRNVAAAAWQAGRRPRIGDAITLEELEERHIRAVLGKARSLQEAAETLGIAQQALYRRRKQFGI